MNGVLYLIMCDLINNYGDLLDRRIKESLQESSGRVYAGDIFTYFAKLIENNVNALLGCDPEEIPKVMQHVANLYLYTNGIDRAEWTEGWEYILI